MKARRNHHPHALLLLMLLSLSAGPVFAQKGLESDRQALLEELREGHGLDEEHLAAVREVLAGAPFLGRGNPAVSEPAMSAEACRERRAAAGLVDPNPEFEKICGAPFMAPLYDPASADAEQAPVCIDQFEFPGLPCAFPVVWVRASEAAALCEAIGKRLCDAHEWEGACAGALHPPDYDFELARGRPADEAVKAMRAAHNRRAERSWSYGPAYREGVCAAASRKSTGCDGGGWSKCGSNTYPTGAFPACTSELGVFDLHGNAAEHMNLPLAPEQMASRGEVLGVTEMKGSWFIFDHYRAHEDWCRWRAPFWHGSRVRDASSHHNYHLGFRCCRDAREVPIAP